jgi:putative flippase GtrA
MFCKAQLTAQIATIVDFGISLLLAEGLGIWYVWSSLLGALTGGLTNCGMNYRWVFDTEGLKKKNVVVKYFIVWTGSITLNTLGTYALTELSRQHFIFAKAAIAVCVAIFWNYQLQRNFVYKDIHLKEKLGIEN